MNAVLVETVIDVRTLVPREKHPTIFKAWTALDQGGSLVLINDHDPLPLYYQLACEHEGTFRWDYLEQGPDLWRVRISKGDFADPGFVPIRKTEQARAAIAGSPSDVDFPTLSVRIVTCRKRLVKRLWSFFARREQVCRRGECQSYFRSWRPPRW